MRLVRGLFCVVALAAAAPLTLAPATAEPRSAIELAAPADQPAASPMPVSVAAPVRPAAPPRPAVTLAARVDLTQQTLTVIENGRKLYTWKISSGVIDHATPVGNFQPEWTAKMWYSRKYDDAPMPHAVFFKNGAAVHATQAVGALGHAASHGCVRLAPANAEIFYRLVQHHGLVHTRISVFGTPDYQRPQLVSHHQRAPRNLYSPGPSYAAARNQQLANAGPFTGGGIFATRLPISAIRPR